MTAPASVPSVRQFFSRNGLLSQWHANFEFRPGQLEMAEAVENALRTRTHLMVEAGTGTGKTLAYLIPALLAGRRVVVSTGTKNLQEQLLHKDIPLLTEHFPQPLRVAVMKGRNNYLCRQKVYDADREPVLRGLEEVSDFQIIREWEKSTETGDRAEVKTLPETSTLWPRLDARRDLCAGAKCQQFERCFLTKMYADAAEADLIIVNHHLFFADLAVKQNEFGFIIPRYEAVIFDEAHELEDVAGQYFGVALSSHQVGDLAGDTLALSYRKHFASDELDKVIATLKNMADRFWECFDVPDGRTAFPHRLEWAEEHHDACQNLMLALELIAAQLQIVQDPPEELTTLVRRAIELREKLLFWTGSKDASYVFYVEKRGRGIFLQATPIDVAGLLKQKVFDQIDSVVMTSATLTVGGTFEHSTQRLGLEYVRTLDVPSPFDYEDQALLYVPQHLPDPRSAAWTRPAAQEVLRLVRASRGRAFLLFTSHAQMRLMFDRLSFDLDYPCLLQGTGPRHALLEEFRNTPNAVLFATSSFWQGVDVQGEQLSLVVVDRLPFAVPTDPVVAARSEAIRSRGADPFREYQVPEAAIALKQGFGRLIRGKRDRGVLALLDNRITRQRYGQVFFDSLPPYGFTTDIGDVERFFDV